MNELATDPSGLLSAKLRRQSNGAWSIPIPANLVREQGWRAGSVLNFMILTTNDQWRRRQRAGGQHPSAKFDPGVPDEQVLAAADEIGLKASRKRYGLSQAGMHALLQRNGWRQIGNRWKPPVDRDGDQNRDAVVTGSNGTAAPATAE